MQEAFTEKEASVGLAQKDILRRNNVNVLGEGEHVLVLAHGFGSDQRMWRFIAPELAKYYRVVLFDYVGSGASDVSAFDAYRYATLSGYAQDILDVCAALDLANVTYVGHSISAMTGLIASINAPDVFRDLIMICPSPCFLNQPPEYFGGFDRADLDELIDLMDKNYLGWANYVAPIAIGDTDQPELIESFSDGLCASDLEVCKTFAKATFYADVRHLLPQAKHSTLIIHSDDDDMANPAVGKFVEQNIPDSQLEIVQTRGHCPHITTPDVVFDHVGTFVEARHGA